MNLNNKIEAMKALILFAAGAVLCAGKAILARRPNRNSTNTTPSQPASILPQPSRELPHRWAPRLRGNPNIFPPRNNITRSAPPPSLPRGNSEELKLHWRGSVYYYTTDLPTSVIFKKLILNGAPVEIVHEFPESDEESQDQDENYDRRFEDYEESEPISDEEAPETDKSTQCSDLQGENSSFKKNDIGNLNELFESAKRSSRVHEFTKELFTIVLNEMVVRSLENGIFDLEFARTKLGYGRTIRKKRIIESYFGKTILQNAAGAEQPFSSIKAALASMIEGACEPDGHIIRKFLMLLEFCEPSPQLKHTMIQVLF